MDALVLSGRVEVDLGPFQRELARGPQIARTFSTRVEKEVAQSFTAPKLNAGAFTTLGTTAGAAFKTGVHRTAREPITAPRTDTSGFERAGGEAGRAFTRRLVAEIDPKAIGDRLQTVGNRMTLAITAPTIGFGVLATNYAADAAASAAKFEQVFGTATAGAQTSLDRLYRTVYGTRAELQDYASDVGSIFRGLGASSRDAARLSTEIVQLAGDLAAFKNVDVSESLTALRAGLVGETEPLRTYGVVLSEARIQAEAAARGFVRTGEELTPLGRAYAAYSLILQSTATQQGQAAREAGEAGSAFRSTARDMREAATTIGTELVPQLVPLARSVSGVLREVNQLNPETIQLGIKLAAVGATVGPLLTGIGTLTLGLGAAARAAGGLRTAAGAVAGAGALGGLARLVVPGGVLLTGLTLTAELLSRIGAERRRLEGADADFALTAPTMSRSALTQWIENDTLELQILQRNRQAVLDELAAAGLRVNPEDATGNLLERLRLGAQAVLSPNVQRVVDFNAQIAATKERLETAQSALRGLGAAARTGTGDAAEAAAALRQTFDTTLAGLGGALAVPTIDTKTADEQFRDFLDRANGSVVRVRLLAELDGLADVTIPTTMMGDAIADLRAQYDAVRTARENAMAAAVPDQERINALLREEVALARELAAARAIGPRLRPLARVEVPQIPMPIRTLDVDLVARATQRGEAAAARARAQYGGLRVQLEHVGDTVSALVQVADATGRIGDDARRSLAGVGSLLSGVGRLSDEMARLGSGAGLGDLVKTAGGLSSIVTTVASLGGIVAGMFGPSERELGDQRVLQENNARIRELTAALTQYQNTLGNQTDTLRALGTINIPLFQENIAEAGFGGRLMGGERGAIRAEWAEVYRELARVGLTFADLSAIAEANGIQLERDGRIVSGAFSQLAPAIEAARAAAMRWGESFERTLDRQAFVREFDDVDVNTTAGKQRVLNDSAEVFRTFAPELYERIFAGLDLTTAAGRAAADANLAKYAQEFVGAEFQAGRGWLYDVVKDSDFFHSGELERTFLGAEGAIDAFTDAAHRATADLSRPAGFMKEFLEGIAQDPIGPTVPVPVAPTPPPPPPPRRTETPDERGRDRVTINETNHYTVTIVGADRSATELYDEIEAVGRERARARRGARAASQYTLGGR